ncbi:MAG TPA: hypothetical protein VLM85_18770 [Polyangiaceae bacterium]|nr:hypothetical protein [Polyangiaceae bacterium]
MRRLSFLALIVAACGGTVAGIDGGTEAGTDSGCPQPPSAPVYDCEAGALDAEGCGPWSSTQPTPRYPIGCGVTTTQQGTFCGPVTCNCTTTGLPDSGPGWVCPL